MKLKNIGYAVFIAATAAAFVIGSGGSSEAKAKKKMAAPPPPATCWLTAEKAVCGKKGNMTFTYVNSCYAAKDGAKVVSDKACPAKKAVKAHKKGGKKKMGKPAKTKKMKK